MADSGVYGDTFICKEDNSNCFDCPFSDCKRQSTDLGDVMFKRCENSWQRKRILPYGFKAGRKGLVCPVCGNASNGVFSGANCNDKTYKRYRKCKVCGKNFATKERYVSDDLDKKIRGVS